ncbi:MAG: hypothetical protein HY930_03385 [Euryarchaeota archaeon]|nr:hypothetical protein [Euryarchaeota archaeon]
MKKYVFLLVALLLVGSVFAAEGNVKYDRDVLSFGETASVELSANVDKPSEWEYRAVIRGPCGNIVAWAEEGMKNTSYWARHENGRKIVLEYKMPSSFENCKIAKWHTVEYQPYRAVLHVRNKYTREGYSVWKKLVLVDKSKALEFLNTRTLKLENLSEHSDLRAAKFQEITSSVENPELKAQWQELAQRTDALNSGRNSLIAQAIEAASDAISDFSIRAVKTFDEKLRELHKELKYIRDMTNKLKEVKA